MEEGEWWQWSQGSASSLVWRRRGEERIGPTKSGTPYLCRGVSSNIATIHHGHLHACTLHLFRSKFSCDAVKVKGVLLFNYWRY
jgi:hypothetical protein